MRHLSLVFSVAMGLAALAAGCGSSTGPSTTAGRSPIAPPPTTDSTATTLALGGGHVLAAAEVTCHLAKRAQGGVIRSDDGRLETACDQRHNQESFTLTGTQELDDCYRAVAASSDVAIGPDSFDATKLEFADSRIAGHTFATGDGSTTPSVSCAIDLRDDRSTPLLAASP